MADKKISQLTGASTPLAGTEVLPIVQSGSTVKVASDNLTVKNVRSNATSGILQVTGPAAAATRTMTVPDANFTAARTDAGQTFSGTQAFSTINTSAGYQFRGADDTSYEALRVVGGSNNPGLFISAVEATKKVRLNATGSLAAGHELCLGAEGTQDVLRVGVSNVTLSTGNLIVGTAAKGIDFSANTGAAGMTSELLNWYEEGTWTPTQGAGLTVVGAFSSSGTYTRVGRLVTIFGTLSGATSIAASSGGAITSGAPFTAATATAGAATTSNLAGSVIYVSAGSGGVIYSTAALAAAGSIIITASYYV